MTTNDRRLVDYCKSKYLRIENSYYKHTSIHKSTWIHKPTRKERMLDLFLSNKKIRGAMKDVRVRNKYDNMPRYLVHINNFLGSLTVLSLCDPKNG